MAIRQRGADPLHADPAAAGGEAVKTTHVKLFVMLAVACMVILIALIDIIPFWVGLPAAMAIGWYSTAASDWLIDRYEVKP
jgi:hypothetical protein